MVFIKFDLDIVLFKSIFKKSLEISYLQNFPILKFVGFQFFGKFIYVFTVLKDHLSKVLIWKDVF